MNIVNAANSIVMASDVSNRYTNADYLADQKTFAQEHHEKNVAAWLTQNPRIGSLNSGKYYYYDVNRHYQTIEVFGVISEELPATHISNILKRVTILEAEEYKLASEKYLFCLDYLDISANQANADHLVEKLEEHFETLTNDLIII